MRRAFSLPNWSLLHLELNASFVHPVVGRSCEGIPRETQARSGEAEANGPYTVRISQTPFSPDTCVNAGSLVHLAETFLRLWVQYRNLQPSVSEKQQWVLSAVAR